MKLHEIQELSREEVRELAQVIGDAISAWEGFEETIAHPPVSLRDFIAAEILRAGWRKDACHHDVISVGFDEPADKYVGTCLGCHQRGRMDRSEVESSLGTLSEILRPVVRAETW